ncbi:hypothetical protein H311_04431 [Anncaliia algerae PRA109]|nr:hypothetical protein H311_04431 [Anncaliia algerae PRA109]
MKLPQGKYKVIATLDISRSLFTQQENKTAVNTNVHKVLLQNGEENFIAFFLGINFGPNSVIEIKNDSEVPVIKNEDYFIIKRNDPSINLEIVKQLLEKNKINKN